MRPPPPLTLQCAPSRAWRIGCAALFAAAASSLAAWLVGHAEARLPWAAAVVVLAAAAGAMLGVRMVGPMQPAQVAWDGGQWTVDAMPGELQLMLDLERWLLLRLRPAAPGAGARWLPVSCAPGAADWRAFRTALYFGPLRAGEASLAAEAAGAARTDAAEPTSDAGRRDA